MKLVSFRDGVVTHTVQVTQLCAARWRASQTGAGNTKRPRSQLASVKTYENCNSNNLRNRSRDPGPAAGEAAHYPIQDVHVVKPAPPDDPLGPLRLRKILDSLARLLQRTPAQDAGHESRG